MHVIHTPENYSFDKDGHKGKIFPMNHLTNAIQYILVETEKGLTISLKEHVSVFTYFVLKGSGYFIIDGEEEACKTGDLIIVPPAKKFTFKGSLTMLAGVTPPWKAEQEEIFA